MTRSLRCELFKFKQNDVMLSEVVDVNFPGGENEKTTVKLVPQCVQLDVI